MIGGSEGVGLPIYQNQVSRDNQIQRSQETSQEAVEETSPQQMGSDDASFSEEAMELSRAAVTPTNETPTAANDMQMTQTPQQSDSSGSAMPGNLLNVVA